MNKTRTDWENTDTSGTGYGEIELVPSSGYGVWLNEG